MRCLWCCLGWYLGPSLAEPVGDKLSAVLHAKPWVAKGSMSEWSDMRCGALEMHAHAHSVHAMHALCGLNPFDSKGCATWIVACVKSAGNLAHPYHGNAQKTTEITERGFGENHR